jgi:RNA polymerase sigma factor (sigma-70 family)
MAKVESIAECQGCPLSIALNYTDVKPSRLPRSISRKRRLTPPPEGDALSPRGEAQPPGGNAHSPREMDLWREPLVHSVRQKLTRAVGSILRSTLGRSENPGYAEDIVAEALAAAYEKRQRYDPENGPLYPWLLQIAKNRALDFVRRHREFGRELALSDAPSSSPVEPPSELPPEDDDETSPKVFALRRALERLRRYDRELLIVRLGSTLDYCELERYFDFTVRRSTLRVHVGRARKRLCRELAKEIVFRELLAPPDR